LCAPNVHRFIKYDVTNNYQRKRKQEKSLISKAF